jgi:hypothetical protein
MWLILCLTLLVLCSACSARNTDTTPIRGKIDLNVVLSWLPDDTETLLVANRPFWMSTFRMAQDYSNREVTTEDAEKHFERVILQLFDFSYGQTLIEKHLEGKRVLFALEASRHFRHPAGLGELPFEGCALAIFEDDLKHVRDVFMKDVAQKSVRVDEIAGQKVAVFDEKVEQDTWRTFVTFPQNGIVLVATNQRFLEAMLARMSGGKGGRALPDTLPEWRYVNKQAQFWGLRHYDKTQANEDPTSPFGGKKSANFPDDKAIGLTYECNPSKEHKATLTYLSGADDARKIEQSWFPPLSEPAPGATAGLHIQYRELEPRVIQSTYDLSRSQPLEWFFFLFMGLLGHSVYL